MAKMANDFDLSRTTDFLLMKAMNLNDYYAGRQRHLAVLLNGHSEEA